MLTIVVIEEKQAANPDGRVPFGESQIVGDPTVVLGNDEAIQLGDVLKDFGSLGFAVENIRSLASFYRITTACPKVGSSLIGSENGENSFGPS